VHVEQKRIACCILDRPAVALGAAIRPFPYGYYMLLRVVVFMAAGLIALHAYEQDQPGLWPFAFAATAIVFNPFLPFHLGREIWLFVDIGAAALFIANYLSLHQAKATSRSE
jgi:hypothetical protein